MMLGVLLKSVLKSDQTNCVTGVNTNNFTATDIKFNANFTDMFLRAD